MNKIEEPDEEYYLKCLKEAASLCWTDKGLHEGLARDVQNAYGTCILKWAAVVEKIVESSIFVGLHPDQASGDMIDVTISHIKNLFTKQRYKACD